MRALQATGIVTPAHQLVVDVPSDVPSGPHRVVVVLDETLSPRLHRGPTWPCPEHNGRRAV